MKGAIISINDNVLVIKTIMLLNRFDAEKLRQKIIKDAEEGVVIIPGFFDAEIIQKPDDVIIECFKDLCDECLDKLHIFLNGAELIMKDGKND